ncbi:MAG: hypothetical protein RI936_1506 [Pseudomonadota bacterium]|jgi:hypothetical protein
MRQNQVTVSFGPTEEFEFQFAVDDAANPTPEQARAWFDREFVALECDLPSPVGKVLSADRVMSVAKYSGARRFRTDPAWGALYARHTAALLGRDSVRVDLVNDLLGY